MFNQALSMNNSKDIVANSIKLVNENEMRDINDIFLSKLVNYYPKIYIDDKFSNYYTKNTNKRVFRFKIYQNRNR